MGIVYVRDGQPFAAFDLSHPAVQAKFKERYGDHVPLDEIVYLKAELKYITIRTAVREYLLEESLTRLESEFGNRFVRVHRNCLVARDYIRGFERRVNDDGDAHWEVLLNGVPESLPVSRRQQFVVRDVGRESVA